MSGALQDVSKMKELLASFPEWSEEIQKIYSKNQNFREATEDYFFCKRKLAQLSGNSDENMTLLEQYKNTLRDLEEEMMDYLSK
jgi:uncharacterized coiled-coil DUF342 family protein